MSSRHSGPAASRRPALVLAALLAAAPGLPAQAVTNAPLTGEIQFLTLDTPGDHWSSGRMVVGGQTIILPRNLLLDLPANRLTLNQLFEQAPPACQLSGESGLARGDACNASGAGGWATVTANRSEAGNVIAGDVLVSKGLEVVSGAVTFVSYDHGYFRLNGAPGDAATGVMVRLNDPGARHTIQQGPGCAAGSAVNCSPDPRFTLDPDNYTNVFSSGYPMCIPSTVPRQHGGFPAATGVAAIPAGTTAAAANGTGDVLCPVTNRTVNGGLPVQDSRRFAPVMLGDHVTAEGNFETVEGVRFLSAHTTMNGTVALATPAAPDMPDYLFVDEFEIDAAGFQNQRARSLMIGFASRLPVDVLVYSIHYDPVHNGKHLFPLASVAGCDAAAGAGTCGGQGLVGAGNRIWKIRHDVDFLAGAKPKVNPCAHLASDPRMSAGVCPGGAFTESNVTDQFGILSPMPHEIQTFTGHRLAHPALADATRDVSGNVATNGQYLFPFGVGLGGIALPEMVEIDLNNLGSPVEFSGLPWTLDRRLSPGGCIDTTGDGVPDCEATPQPLDPYPFEALDPRTQASVPNGPYAAPAFTAAPLTRAADRILSYVDGALGKFNGNATVLAWPPAAPAAFSISPTPEVALVCAAPPPPPPALVVGPDAAATVAGAPVTLLVLANDADPAGGALAVTAVGPAAHGATATDGAAVTFTPAAGFTGIDTFSYTVASTSGATATGTVTVSVAARTNAPPVALADAAAARAGVPVVIPVLANDADADGDPLVVVAATPGASGATSHDGTTVTYTAAAGFSGTDTFQYTVSDGLDVATATVTVTVTNPEVLAVSVATFRTNTAEWRVQGTTTVTTGATITIHDGPTLAAPVLATVVADATGAWLFRQAGSAVRPDPTLRLSVESSGGATLLVGSSRVDLQACKLEYSIVSPK